MTNINSPQRFIYQEFLTSPALPYHQTVSAPNKTLLEGFFRNASWKGPGGYTPFGLALNYRYQKDENWGIGGTYELNSYSIRDPEPNEVTQQCAAL